MLNKKKIAEIVDELGSLNEQSKAIEKRMKELKEMLPSEGVYEGNIYSATVTTTINAEYDKKAIAKKLKFDLYVEVSKPMITEVKKYISENELQKYILEIKTTPKVIIKKLKE